MSRCFTWFPFSELEEPKLYQNLVWITICGGFTWRVSDCEELSGGYLDSLWLCEELSGGLLGGDDGVGLRGYSLYVTP